MATIITVKTFERSVLRNRIPSAEGLGYSAAGLAGEAGEFNNFVKRIIAQTIKEGYDPGVHARLKDYLKSPHPCTVTKMDLVWELGDTLWYITSSAHAVESNLTQIIQTSERLQSFKETIGKTKMQSFEESIIQTQIPSTKGLLCSASELAKGAGRFNDLVNKVISKTCKLGKNAYDPGIHAKLDKYLQSPHPCKVSQTDLICELGNALGHCTRAAHAIGSTLNEIAHQNIIKLEKRYGTGKKS